MPGLMVMRPGIHPIAGEDVFPFLTGSRGKEKRKRTSSAVRSAFVGQ